MLCGFQILRGEATGSFVYQLILNTKEYSGRLASSVPHSPITGSRAGESIQVGLFKAGLLDRC
jgi:hypothetical protein